MLSSLEQRVEAPQILPPPHLTLGAMQTEKHGSPGYPNSQTQPSDLHMEIHHSSAAVLYTTAIHFFCILRGDVAWVVGGKFGSPKRLIAFDEILQSTEVCMSNILG